MLPMNDKNTNKDSSTPDKSLPELLGQLVDNASAVFHHEIELVIQRIREKARTVLCGVVTVAAGAAISFAALLSFCAALIIGLTAYMTPVMASLITGAALAFFGTVIGFIGFRKLKK